MERASGPGSTTRLGWGGLGRPIRPGPGWVRLGVRAWRPRVNLDLNTERLRSSKPLELEMGASLRVPGVSRGGARERRRAGRRGWAGGSAESADYQLIIGAADGLRLEGPGRAGAWRRVHRLALSSSERGPGAWVVGSLTPAGPTRRCNLAI